MSMVVGLFVIFVIFFTKLSLVLQNLMTEVN